MHTDDVSAKLADGTELEDEWRPLTVSFKASRIPASMFPLEERIAVLVDVVNLLYGVEIGFCSSDRPELLYAVYGTIEPWNSLNFLGQVVNFLFIQEYDGQHRPYLLVGSGSDVLELYPYDGNVQFRIIGTTVDDDPYELAACFFEEILAGFEVGLIGFFDETRETTLHEIQRIGEILRPHMKAHELFFFTEEGLTSVMRADSVA